MLQQPLPFMAISCDGYLLSNIVFIVCCSRARCQRTVLAVGRQAFVPRSLLVSIEQEREQEQEYLFDPKNVYVVYFVDTVNIIKIIWLPMTYQLNNF